ncbi:MAG: type II toxin-antitoxin system mRNA interferase toxin, RelE/StbE family [bacterium]
MMKLNLTKKFKKDTVKLVSANPSLRNKLHDVLNVLSENPFSPSLKTHKLKGELKDFWSISLTYEFRIIVQFRRLDDETVIDLLTIGTHDEVY